MKTRRNRRTKDKAAPDLTPMIDVTFQLLIFFILCTRFKADERNFNVQLPDDEGFLNQPEVPVEKLTIYCNYDPEIDGNSYVLAIEARGRKPVQDSFARLSDLVIFSSDNNATIAAKQARYKSIHNALVAAADDYIRNSGANIRKIEIAFAKDAAAGASSGTAPWMFVSAAIDAAAKLNQNRDKVGEPELPVTFKFTDALGAYR